MNWQQQSSVYTCIYVDIAFTKLFFFFGIFQQENFNLKKKESIQNDLSGKLSYVMGNLKGSLEESFCCSSWYVNQNRNFWPSFIRSVFYSKLHSSKFSLFCLRANNINTSRMCALAYTMYIYSLVCVSFV